MTRQDPESFGSRGGASAAIPASLPRLPGLDHTLRFLNSGYPFIGQTCDRLGVDGFRARLMLREAFCLRGPEAAALLYGRSGTTRVGAMPTTVLRLLQDKGSVQQLEGEAHRRRKALFIRLVMDPARVDDLTRRFEQAWMRGLTPDCEITVLDHANTALTRAVCGWAGLDLSERDIARMTRILFRMSDRSGHFGPGTVATLWQRRALERQLRSAMRDATGDTPLAVLARELPPGTAAVELLNILRPVVAIGRYIAFAAKALHEHPMWCELFRSGNDDYIADFCEEVRRTAPFFPAAAAIATEELVWQGAIIPKGSWLLLDLFGTNRDARHFPMPERFRPERMLDWTAQDDCFIPQGAGKVERSHRCPGEMATLALMSSAVRMLCCRMEYTLPPQDIGVALNRVPARPASGVRIRIQRVSRETIPGNSA
ncbi:cytochrome P450 [Cereibacter sp. SYSU M97828]|nr:cytochrome P450 [Cereibacter flavus]